MPYDLLLVGAGITSATICARLKHKAKICVVDARPHIAGNCFDYKSGNTFVHSFGPHLFHSPNQSIVDFLSQFTEWVPLNYTVTGEIEDGKIKRVPFPYSRETERVLGRKLSEAEVLEKFFHGYSLKMWGMPYERLPGSIKGRVPKDSADRPQYFPGQFQALPKYGYTTMIEKMFDGVETILNFHPDEWTQIKASKIIFCGRIDKALLPNGKTIADECGRNLNFRSLKFDWKVEDWDAETMAVNFCHTKITNTRKTHMGRIYGDTSSRTVLYETPYQAGVEELSPFYPIPTIENLADHQKMVEILVRNYPNLVPCGRLGTFKYLDMFQAIGHGLAVAEKLN